MVGKVDSQDFGNDSSTNEQVTYWSFIGRPSDMRRPLYIKVLEWFSDFANAPFSADLPLSPCLMGYYIRVNSARYSSAFSRPLISYLTTDRIPSLGVFARLNSSFLCGSSRCTQPRFEKLATMSAIFASCIGSDFWYLYLAGQNGDLQLSQGVGTMETLHGRAEQAEERTS